MIIRFSLFISLLALFYYYCREDSSDQFRQPNDLNLIEVPVELSPTLNYKNYAEYAENDTAIDTLFTQYSTRQESISGNSSMLMSSITQNY